MPALPRNHQTEMFFRIEIGVDFRKSLFRHPLLNRSARHVVRVEQFGNLARLGGIVRNQEAERLLAAGTARYSELEGGGPLLVDHELTDADGWRFRTSHPRLPEQRIAVREADALGFHAGVGLELTEVRYGHWCGRERAAETLGQDLIAARA